MWCLVFPDLLVHAFGSQKFRDIVPYLPYFESIKLEGLCQTRNSKAGTEPADSGRFNTLKNRELCMMDSEDSIVVRCQAGREIDVPRLVHSAFRTGNTSRELQAKLLDV